MQNYTNFIIKLMKCKDFATKLKRTIDKQQ